MTDDTYEAVVTLDNGRVWHIQSEAGVVDMARSQGDAEGNLRDFTYDQTDPEKALDIAAHLVKAALAAKNFHAETVEALRAQNGAHADGEA